ncbi:hypothetical protein Pyn_38495 [Prunus yedoensis var. nudiflora]|uniref:Uncharacterized protein n=1 Tax=Prunus yedoensis var. nudiflora TaxID=2094558 RepID=A0A314YX22_PRUYE|nr:hypothetical protein Pyn_38495 [Prunus yedoensis var. nudiflora]
MGFLWTSCGQPIPRRRNTFQLQPKRKTDKRALLPYAWLVDLPVPLPVPEVSKLAWDHAPLTRNSNELIRVIWSGQEESFLFASTIISFASTAP